MTPSVLKAFVSPPCPRKISRKSTLPSHDQRCAKSGSSSTVTDPIVPSSFASRLSLSRLTAATSGASTAPSEIVSRSIRHPALSSLLAQAWLITPWFSSTVVITCAKSIVSRSGSPGPSLVPSGPFDIGIHTTRSLRSAACAA